MSALLVKRVRLAPLDDNERVRVMEIKADCICDALTRFRHSCDLNYGRLFDDARTVELGQTEDWYRTVIGARVDMGACALDARSQAEGTSWFNVVDLDALNIKDSRFCVLGMVYGHFSEAPNELRHRGHGEAFGFAWYNETEWIEHAENSGALGGPGITEECRLLAHYWGKAIKARRRSAELGKQAARIVPDGFTESLGF